MKQSVGLVILQVLGIVVGLVNTFWVAGSIPSKLYAVVGIQGVISSIIIIFSNTGLETHGIRNILLWKEKGEILKIKRNITQAITIRTLLATVIFLPMIGYASYISRYKFNSQYLLLFIAMGACAIASALNDAVILMLKAFNKYLFAAFVSYSVNVFGRVVALFLFFSFGFDAYIITIMLLPLLITLPVIYIIKEWFDFKGSFIIKELTMQLKIAKPFALSSYISYLFNYFDQLIVSLFLTTEVLGSFTMGKNILGISKQLIENIFDPLIQNLVRFKEKSDILREKLLKIFKLRNILIAIGFLIFPIIFVFLDTIIACFNLTHYPYLDVFIISIFVGQIAHIGVKIKYNFIALFYQSTYYLKLTIVNASLSVLTFILVSFVNIEYIFIYIAITNIIMIFITRYIFSHNNLYFVRIAGS